MHVTKKHCEFSFFTACRAFEMDNSGVVPKLGPARPKCLVAVVKGLTIQSFDLIGKLLGLNIYSLQQNFCELQLRTNKLKERHTRELEESRQGKEEVLTP